MRSRRLIHDMKKLVLNFQFHFFIRKLNKSLCTSLTIGMKSKIIYILWKKWENCSPFNSSMKIEQFFFFQDLFINFKISQYLLLKKPQQLQYSQRGSVYPGPRRRVNTTNAGFVQVKPGTPLSRRKGLNF